MSYLYDDGTTVADYLNGLEDSDLNRIGYFTLAGGEISTKQCAEKIILQRGSDHLSSMKKTIG